MKHPNKSSSVIIIGAGISGLMCASRLSQAGVDVRLLDKGRRVGGRMSTRQFEGGIFDHGAQFFSAKSSTFQRYVTSWKEKGIAKIWFDTSKDPAQTHARYIGCEGMNSIPRYLGSHLPHDCSVTIESLSYTHQWTLTSPECSYTADHLILTPPGPQSYNLLSTASSEIQEQCGAKLPSFNYEKGLAILLVLQNKSTIPAPGYLKPNHPDIAWIADNNQKGISPIPALTVHTTAQFAEAYWDSQDTDKINAVISSLRPWLSSSVVAAQAHRWGYTLPLHKSEKSTLYFPNYQLQLAGDAFGGPRVEGAALSGLAAAKEWLSHNSS
jgi:predicted NAD/FAD-dependent oxidoreductase